MKLHLGIEESAELRLYALELIKSQVKHIVRNELNTILREQIDDQIKEVRKTMDDKLRGMVSNYLHGYYISKELHKMVAEFLDTQIKEELSGVLSTLKDNIAGLCLHGIINNESPIRDEK